MLMEVNYIIFIFIVLLVGNILSAQTENGLVGNGDYGDQFHSNTEIDDYVSYDPRLDKGTSHKDSLEIQCD